MKIFPIQLVVNNIFLKKGKNQFDRRKKQEMEIVL